jgi:hypothetical protein
LLQEPIHELVLTWESADSSSHPAIPTYQGLTATAKRHMPCESLALYIIDPGSGAYRRVGQAGDPPAPRSVPGLPRPCDDEEGAEIQQLLREAVRLSNESAKVATFQRYHNTSHVIGLRYEQTPYAFFFAMANTACSEQVAQTITALTELAFLTFQNRAARNALRANEQPIDVTGDEATFHEELRKFIVQATGMHLIALRQRGAPGTSESKNLRCIIVSGWDEPVSEFDLIDYSRFPHFDRAVANRAALFSPDKDSDESQNLWAELPHLRIVESFAVFRSRTMNGNSSSECGVQVSL